MRTIVFLALALLLGSASASGSGWVYQEEKDELRGTVSQLATLRSEADSPAENVGLSSFLTVRRRGDEPGVVFVFEGDRVKCPKETCEILAKFDSGAINELMGPGDGRGFVPWKQGAIAAVLQITDRLVIEVDFAGKGKQQFVFRTAGLPIKTTEYPSVPVLRYRYGASPQEVVGLGESKKVDADEVCYNSLDPGPLVMDGLSGSGLVCFVKDRLYQVVLNKPTGDKKTLARLRKHLDIIYGKGNSSVSLYTSWPKIPEGMDRFTSGAAELGESFIFTDKSLRLLAPERMRPD